MKILLVSLGMLCVALGFIGIFLPLLPTTPFLLLALFLFARSSPRYRAMILENKLMGPYVAGYASGAGIPLKIKIWSISVLWVTILSSALFFTEKTWVKWMLLGIATGVTIHILMKKTAPKNPEKSNDDNQA